MSEQRQKKHPVSKKHQPHGLTILYEDRDIIVVDKRSGLLTVSTERIREKTAYQLLTHYVQKGNPKSYNRVCVVHRLDRDTSGVLIFAKTEQAKRYLREEWQNFTKIYYAVVHGTLREKEGIITSYLAENRAHNMYSVNDPKQGELARTKYKVLRESQKYSLLEIELLTGKKNQIRVHFSEKGCPVVGDVKYGAHERGSERLALHAASLTLTHPFTKAQMTFQAKVPDFFETLIGKQR